MKPASHSPRHSGRSGGPPPTWLPAATVFLAAFAFYTLTLAPSLTWADGARLAIDVMMGGSTYMYAPEAGQVATDGYPFDHLGVVAWDHPLYVMAGQVFLRLPVGEPLWRVNLMSAFFGALAVALVFALGKRLTNATLPAAVGALALAIAHTFWFHATTAEVYTLHAAFMAGLLLLALRWPEVSRTPRARVEWAVFGLLAGLGLANHLMLVLTILPCLAYMLLAGWLPGVRHQPRAHRAGRFLAEFALLGAFFVLGWAPYWIQFARMARIIGVQLTLELAGALPWLGPRMAPPSLMALLVNTLSYIGMLLYQFTPVGAALGVVGFYKLVRRRAGLAALLLALYFLHAIFSANYAVPDRFAFHLPSYVIFALGIACGLAELRSLRLGSSARRTAYGTAWSVVLLVPPIALYTLLPALLPRLGVDEARLGIYPIGTGARDTLAYFLNPNHRGDDSATRFGRQTLEALPQDALVVTPKSSDQEAYLVLRYFQLVEGLRADVHLDMMLFDPAASERQAVLNLVTQQIGCRPVFLASLSPRGFPIETLRSEYQIVPQANLYRVLPRALKQSSNSPQVCLHPSERWGAGSLSEMIRMATRLR